MNRSIPFFCRSSLIALLLLTLLPKTTTASCGSCADGSVQVFIVNLTPTCTEISPEGAVWATPGVPIEVTASPIDHNCGLCPYPDELKTWGIHVWVEPCCSAASDNRVQVNATPSYGGTNSGGTRILEGEDCVDEVKWTILVAGCDDGDDPPGDDPHGDRPPELGSGTGPGLGSIDWKVFLGRRLPDGLLPGAIRYWQSSLDDNSYHPTALTYHPMSDHVEVHGGPTDLPWQIKTPAGFVEIDLHIELDGFDISFYYEAGNFNPQTERYDTSGTPFVTYTIDDPDGSGSEEDRRVRFTEFRPNPNEGPDHPDYQRTQIVQHIEDSGDELWVLEEANRKTTLEKTLIPGASLKKR